MLQFNIQLKNLYNDLQSKLDDWTALDTACRALASRGQSLRFTLIITYFSFYSVKHQLPVCYKVTILYC